MKVTYNIDDTSCPKGHNWIHVPASLLWSDYYYCKRCDQFWEPTIRKINTQKIENVSEGRTDEMKQRAFVVKHRNKVSYEQLRQLGFRDE